MIKSIILDYDGVIRHMNKDKTRELLASHGFTLDEFFSIVWSHQAVTDLITGKINRDEWWKLLQADYPSLLKFDPKFMWDEVFSFPIIDFDLLDYMESLQSEYPSIKLAIFSNADSLSKTVIQDQVDGYNIDLIITSSDLGVAKPDPEAYRQVLQQLLCSPEEAIFVDDSQKNVEAASVMGIHAFLYQSLEHFRSTIQSLLHNIRKSG